MSTGIFTYKYFLAAWLSLAALQNSFSQDNTLYFMHGIPQSVHTNPALKFKCRTYLELPVLSSVQYSFASTGFGYHDVIHPGTGRRADSLVIDVDNLARKLKNRNYFRNDLSINLLGAGFNVKDLHVHFNISENLESRVGYPGDLVRIKDGNWDPVKEETKDINLGGLGATVFSYFHIALGASRQLNGNLRVGATIKYLMGSAAVVNRRSRLDIITGQDPMELTGAVDYRLNASLPIDFSYDPGGYVEHVDFDRTFSNPVRDFILNKNRGAAVDAGVIYEYTDKITLSASIVNLGIIRWGSNVNRFVANGSFTFSGFDLNRYTSNQGETDFLQALVDSIEQSFRFESSQGPFLTLLTTKLYTGAYYRLTDYLNLGGLARTEIYDSRPHLSVTASANASPFSFLNATLSYSFMNNKFNNLGAGLAIGGPAAQFYMIADNIPLRYVRITDTPVIFPYNARTLNIRFGLNIIWGCMDKRAEKQKRAKPRSNRNLCPAYW